MGVIGPPQAFSRNPSWSACRRRSRDLRGALHSPIRMRPFSNPSCPSAPAMRLSGVLYLLPRRIVTDRRSPLGLPRPASKPVWDQTQLSRTFLAAVVGEPTRCAARACCRARVIAAHRRARLSSCHPRAPHALSAAPALTRPMRRLTPSRRGSSSFVPRTGLIRIVSPDRTLPDTRERASAAWIDTCSSRRPAHRSACSSRSRTSWSSLVIFGTILGSSPRASR